jgi:hypothetical protein
MAKNLADLRERRTELQHANSQGVPELVRAAVRRVDFGAMERVAHDRADAVRPFHQPAYRCHGSKEEVPIWTGRTPALEIGGDRLAHIGGQWQETLAATLATHTQLSAVPVDVVQRQPDYLAGSKSQSC